MSRSDTRSLTEERKAYLAELVACRHAAEEVYERLTRLDVRSGATGLMRKAIEKMDGAIDWIERRGAEWDAPEKLACNAWRISQMAEGVNLPDNGAWFDLSDEIKDRWRVASRTFSNTFIRTGGQSGGSDVGVTSE